MLLALGKVVAHWSVAQMNMEMLICKLMESPYDLALAVVSQFNYSGRLDMLRALAKEKFKNDTEAQNEIKTIIQKLDATYAKRNRFEHDALLHQGEDSDPARKRRVNRKTLVTEIEEVKTEDIENLAKEISVLALEIYDFHNKHLSAKQKPSPEK